MTTDRSQKYRTFYAELIAGHRDPRVRDAFAAVPREPFAGPGPWSMKGLGKAYVLTPDDDPAFLYQDALVALDAARGVNIGQPGVHALWLAAVRPQPGEQVLQVGAGSGYYTAILAHLVGPQGRVFAYEIDPDFAARARDNLKDLPQVELRAESAIADGLPKVDVVYVCAGITQPSWAWIEALRPGGRLLFPLQPPEGVGGMLLIERPAQGTAWPAKFVSRAAFINCVGPQDPEAGRRLTAAFAGGWESVRSFWIDDAPDDNCWYSGDGWWLSTEPAETD
ncbi:MULTISPECIES: methyltransferase domain-containing protein [Rhodopseudomonas]|uniref:Protein-L-isoaspartate O-methyltransferase n=1 Tax=Rhodopseudomonas palustris TaxID=1076 RepID=A0A0D7F5J4_RHOPL|nr:MULTISPECIES: methyltransferase domain-containing protein [Rhodopseudomonas]KIZ48046.1 methyltransferase [Rhodopseudomonas palustris]MDF3808709.1 methyltransferase [Rhodopseudomonas sp. BAL398]WOK19769.1 methyltransferase [Rhodopseudomonas sp. BAL398]